MEFIAKNMTTDMKMAADDHSWESTVWKFHDFCITQILREINFRDFQSAKSAILTQLEALNCHLYAILHLLKAVMYQINRIQRPSII